MFFEMELFLGMDMTRFVRDYIDIPNHADLDELIATLTQVRDSLPAHAQAEMRLRGDDIFGRRLTISFLRPRTEDEVACEDKYSQSAPAPLCAIAA